MPIRWLLFVGATIGRPLCYVKLTPIRQQNFMIENNEFFVYSVGANCVRPFGHTVNRAGEHSSPLQIIIIEFTLNYNKNGQIFLI